MKRVDNRAQRAPYTFVQFFQINSFTVSLQNGAAMTGFIAARFYQGRGRHRI
jgi:hypothetical protein